MILREADIADVPGLVPLLAALGYPTTEERLREGMAPILADASDRTVVAEEDGRLVGMTGMRRGLRDEAGNFVQLAALVVDPSARGRGVGRALVADVEAWARSLEAEIITPQQRPPPPRRPRLLRAPRLRLDRAPLRQEAGHAVIALKTVFWDFDGAPARRRGVWSGAILDGPVAAGGHLSRLPRRAACAVSAHGRSVAIYPDERLLTEFRQHQRSAGCATLRGCSAARHSLGHLGRWHAATPAARISSTCRAPSCTTSTSGRGSRRPPRSPPGRPGSLADALERFARQSIHPRRPDPGPPR